MKIILAKEECGITVKYLKVGKFFSLKIDPRGSVYRMMEQAGPAFRRVMEMSSGLIKHLDPDTPVNVLDMVAIEQSELDALRAGVSVSKELEDLIRCVEELVKPHMNEYGNIVRDFGIKTVSVSIDDLRLINGNLQTIKKSRNESA